ncbi:ImpA family metalloprotease [Gallaecimonas xiamenensis]|uniref:Peptidase M60 domain-containing protein n=1 Tax=Gallaecimonas xiamenensis 3-C-1 TaxID=745411 RepID=K2IS43_9GAMM|nr:ImpA family metalloprotease [Gallaecimonas xiamenensis]EKE73076.1 hypothetical protein B3C1_10682 [Gallaecimonas xiamenensis 3-C-1]
MKKTLLLGSLLLAGCGGGGGDPASPSTNQAPSTSPMTLAYQWQTQEASGNWRQFAQDADGDNLNASISQQGQLGRFSLEGDQLLYLANSGAQGQDQGQLTVSDGRGGQATLGITVTQVDGRDGVAVALAQGDASLTSSPALLARIKQEIQDVQASQQQLVTQLFGNGAIDYAPGNRTQLFNVTEPDRTFSLINANGGQVLAIAGEVQGGRYGGIGTHLFARFQAGELLAMAPAAEQLLAWLMQDADLSQPHTLALSFLAGQEEATRQWLEAQHPNWTLLGCSDVAALDNCLAQADLVISGWRGNDQDAAAIVASFQGALAQGKGLFYQHNWYEATSPVADAITELMGASLPYGGNYWANASANWNQAQAMLDQAPWLAAEQRLTQHFIDQDFAFDWSGCTSYVGKVSCDQVAGFDQAFLSGARSLKNALNRLDSQGLDLFAEPNLTLLKLFVLLGDSYRAQIHYPMDKESTDPNQFLAAYLADHLAYYHRASNPAQADLGNFSDPIATAPALVSQTLTFTLNGHSNYRGTGLYLLPGQRIELERTDGQPLALAAFINTQRSGSTREFNANGYLRPKFLRSPQFSLTQGQQQQLTSPYGGPLMVQLPAGSGQVSLKVSNLSPYPYLSDFANAADYLAQLDDSPLAWAGLRTDFVEINSRKQMMKAFIYADRYQGDVTQALDDVWAYMIKGTYDLAGFQGDGLALAGTVAARCTSLGWDCTDPQIHAKPKVQHINVDEAAECGAGCSGNPYDQSWALSPFGWGESHEIGHNLQRSRLKIYGGRSGEVSNNIFPLYKGWQRFHDSGERIESCDRQDPALTYGWLQQAQTQADPSQAMYDKLWSQTGTYDNAGTRLDFYLQLAFMADDIAGLDNGWQLYTLLYLQERLFTQAAADPDRWAAQKGALGMASFATAPDPDGNDFMLMGLSWLLQRDMRGYFDLWGIGYSADAGAQVAAYGFAPAAKVYYQVQSQCADMQVPKLPVDGTSSWPAT